MTWSLLANIAEVFGLLVVVASLGYVAIQIRQNTDAMKNLAAHNLTAANSGANLAISTNDELASILQRGFMDRAGLAPHEQLRFNTFFFSAYNHYDLAYRQYLEGQIEEGSWRKMEREVPLFIHLPGVRNEINNHRIRSININKCTCRAF